MKLSTFISVITGLASMVIAAPAPITNEIHKRDSVNQASCLWSWAPNGFDFQVPASGSWMNDSGALFEKILVHRCEMDTSTNWSYDGTTVYFSLNSTFPPNCVEDAIWWASVTTGSISNVQCEYV